MLVRLSVVATDLTGRSTLRSAPAVKLVSDRKSAAASAARMPAAIHPEPGDVDGDEVRDEFDNCPTVRNGSQVNTDAALPRPGSHRCRRRRAATRATTTTTPTACRMPRDNCRVHRESVTGGQ